ncbi:MAG: TlyA family RNA methyltransferase [Ruminococcus sp.]|nr:TlyA family RNA methyltransferase [Oscillospiraceae bacterium]MDY4414186.1 TlyA family RNA methyltransferase [Ruminococcus sp.]
MNRLDREVFKRGISSSRERATVLIKGGNISVNGKVCIKPSFSVEESDIIELSGDDLKYVGRGGLKLEKALAEFDICLENKICIDIGASTGGFTDCMLKNGASKIYAVDVGHGQLAESLKNNQKVVNLEGTDIRNLSAGDFEKPADFISIDVSFISLKQILPKALELLSAEGIISALIKPQFEAGRQNISKNGIVKDKKTHIRILQDIDSFSRSIGLYPHKYIYSPVRGGSGNIEYLVKLTKSFSADIPDFSALVNGAWEGL